MVRSEKAYHLREHEAELGYSQAVQVGKTLYVSGSVSWDSEGLVLDAGNLKAQWRHAYDDLRKTLTGYGAGFDHVVKETIYTTDMDGALEAASVRREYYGDFTPPAATWVEVRRLLHPDMLVAVEAVARIP